MEHPYFPRDLDLPHYVENDLSLLEILGPFFTFIGLLLVGTWVYTGTVPHLKNSMGGKLKMCWFLSCGMIHLILEGYFSYYSKTFIGKQDFLAQTWKEYSKGDSRYASADSFVVCVETITAVVDGPLSFFAFYAFLCNKPSRYVVQLILSLCQLYGDVLYFYTAYKEGFIHGEMYHPLYFWFYFVFMNVIWIVVPFLCIHEAWKKLTIAQNVDDRSKASLKKAK